MRQDERIEGRKHHGGTTKQKDLPTRPVTSARVLKPTVVAATITIVSLVLGFTLLGEKSFWLDEGYSFAYAQGSWTDLWKVVSTSQANMSLYYVLLHVWLGLGTSELVIRALSVFFIAGTIPLLYALGRRIMGDVPALVACVLFAVNAFSVQFAQEARGYALAVFLSTLSTLLFVHSVEAPARGKWVAYVLVSGVGAYAHFFVAFVLAAHVVALVLLGPRRPRLGTLAAIYGSVAVLVSPLILFVLTRSQGQISWIPSPTPGALVRAFEDLSGGASPWLPLAYLAAALGGAVGARRALRTGRLQPWHGALVAAWFLIPMCGSFLLSFAKPIFVSKYLIVALPALALAAAFGITRLPSRTAIGIAAGAMVVLSAVGLVDWYADYKKDDWRGAARFLVDNTQPGDGLVVVPTRVRKPLEYYVVERFGEAGSAPEPVYPPQGWGAYATKAPKGSQLENLLQDKTSGYERVWLVESRGSKELRRDAAAALAAGFVPSGRRDFTHITIRLYNAR
jgi:4-amino-4-deoxy-L-arabinose transferase-like glycosyltransferase